MNDYIRLFCGLAFALLMAVPAYSQAKSVSFQGVKLELPEYAGINWIVKDGTVNGLDSSIALVDLSLPSSGVTSLFENQLKQFGQYQTGNRPGMPTFSQKRGKWFLTVDITEDAGGTKANIMVTEFNSRKLSKKIAAFKVPGNFEVIQVNRDSVSENASLISRSPVNIAVHQLHSSLVSSGWKKRSFSQLSDVNGQRLQYQKRGKVMELLVLANFIGEYASATYITTPQ